MPNDRGYFNPIWALIIFMVVLGVLVPPVGLILVVLFGPVLLAWYLYDPEAFGPW